jgi:hypothetical protein
MLAEQVDYPLNHSTSPWQLFFCLYFLHYPLFVSSCFSVVKCLDSFLISTYTFSIAIFFVISRLMISHVSTIIHIIISQYSFQLLSSVFISLCRPLLISSCNADLMVMNSLSFCLSGNILISLAYCLLHSKVSWKNEKSKNLIILLMIHFMGWVALLMLLLFDTLKKNLWFS